MFPKTRATELNFEKRDKNNKFLFYFGQNGKNKTQQNIKQNSMPIPNKIQKMLVTNIISNKKPSN